MATQVSPRAVIVTGASSGIGSAIARQLGATGYDLRLVGRSMDGLRATVSSISAAGGRGAHCEAADLARPGALADLVRRVGETIPTCSLSSTMPE